MLRSSHYHFPNLQISVVHTEIPLNGDNSGSQAKLAKVGIDSEAKKRLKTIENGEIRLKNGKIRLKTTKHDKMRRNTLKTTKYGMNFVYFAYLPEFLR